MHLHEYPDTGAEIVGVDGALHRQVRTGLDGQPELPCGVFPGQGQDGGAVGQARSAGRFDDEPAIGA